MLSSTPIKTVKPPDKKPEISDTVVFLRLCGRNRVILFKTSRTSEINTGNIPPAEATPKVIDLQSIYRPEILRVFAQGLVPCEFAKASSF